MGSLFSSHRRTVTKETYTDYLVHGIRILKTKEIAPSFSLLGEEVPTLENRTIQENLLGKAVRAIKTGNPKLLRAVTVPELNQHRQDINRRINKLRWQWVEAREKVDTYGQLFNLAVWYTRKQILERRIPQLKEELEKARKFIREVEIKERTKAYPGTIFKKSDGAFIAVAPDHQMTVDEKKTEDADTVANNYWREKIVILEAYHTKYEGRDIVETLTAQAIIDYATNLQRNFSSSQLEKLFTYAAQIPAFELNASKTELLKAVLMDSLEHLPEILGTPQHIGALAVKTFEKGETKDEVEMGDMDEEDKEIEVDEKGVNILASVAEKTSPVSDPFPLVQQLSKLTEERAAVQEMMERGQGFHDGKLESKLTMLDTQISQLEAEVAKLMTVNDAPRVSSNKLSVPPPQSTKPAQSAEPIQERALIVFSPLTLSVISEHVSKYAFKNVKKQQAIKTEVAEIFSKPMTFDEVLDRLHELWENSVKEAKKISDQYGALVNTDAKKEEENIKKKFREFFRSVQFPAGDEKESFDVEAIFHSKIGDISLSTLELGGANNFLRDAIEKYNTCGVEDRQKQLGYLMTVACLIERGYSIFDMRIFETLKEKPEESATSPTIDIPITREQIPWILLISALETLACITPFSEEVRKVLLDYSKESKNRGKDADDKIGIDRRREVTELTRLLYEWQQPNKLHESELVTKIQEHIEKAPRGPMSRSDLHKKLQGVIDSEKEQGLMIIREAVDMSQRAPVTQPALFALQGTLSSLPALTQVNADEAENDCNPY